MYEEAEACFKDSFFSEILLLVCGKARNRIQVSDPGVCAVDHSAQNTAARPKGEAWITYILVDSVACNHSGEYSCVA